MSEESSDPLLAEIRAAGTREIAVRSNRFLRALSCVRGARPRCARTTNPLARQRAKQGLGRAYVAAFRELIARDADIVVQIDADFSHPVRYLPSLLEPLRTQKADLVLGSRYVKGGHIPRWNLMRRLVSRGGSVFAGVVLLLPYRDLTGGYKAWSAVTLQQIDLERLHAGGYAFQIETTFKARLAGARIVEIPITFEERRAGTSKMSMAIFMEAFRLVLALRIGNLRRRRRSLATRP